MDPPSNDEIQSEARPKAVGILEQPILDFATALEDSVEEFNAPTQGIPAKPFDGILEAGYLDRRQQHPLERLFDLRWIIDLPCINCPDLHGLQLAVDRRPEQHGGITDVDLSGPRGTGGLLRNMHHLTSR